MVDFVTGSILILGTAAILFPLGAWSIKRAFARGFDAGYAQAMWDSGEMNRRLEGLGDPGNGTNLTGMTEEELREWLASL